MLVIAPTASGKTVIAEIAILRAIGKKKGVILYTAPTHVILK